MASQEQSLPRWQTCTFSTSTRRWWTRRRSWLPSSYYPTTSSCLVSSAHATIEKVRRNQRLKASLVDRTLDWIRTLVEDFCVPAELFITGVRSTIHFAYSCCTLTIARLVNWCLFKNVNHCNLSQLNWIAVLHLLHVRPSWGFGATRHRLQPLSVEHHHVHQRHRHVPRGNRLWRQQTARSCTGGVSFRAVCL